MSSNSYSTATANKSIHLFKVGVGRLQNQNIPKSFVVEHPTVASEKDANNFD